ncbi:Eukaryotic/viral aspartic protease [Phytophthora megakarya]|uniref:Eukaryotic/viral aspartic protease n=1 Tax=Phytophthora megakarya TaxID=4795 RepID=A0A225V4P1_9STRA|nr:Eukaryotic/viral aspartic protease [Phytophthora megakarya]
MHPGRILQPAASVVRPSEARGYAPAHGREDVKLGRSLAWKPVRDERSMSVYAYVTKRSREGVRKRKATLNDNTCETEAIRTAHERVPRVAAIRHPGERRGYWKLFAPDKWYKQAKIHGKLNSAEVSILDTTFAREVGCLIDTSVTQECVGIRDETYFTVDKTRIKITLAGGLVYYADLWVGDLVGQHAILGMDFMVPAGVRVDAADGTACLPDEVRIQLIGRLPLYGSKMRAVNVPSLTRIATETRMTYR